MDTQQRLLSDMKEAMKSGEKSRLSTIRLIRAAMKNAEIENRGELDEDAVVSVLSSEARKRREAIEEYRKAGRSDLAEIEENELAVIEEYLPEQLSEEELSSIVSEAVRDLGASSPGDVGKVMGAVMPRLKGRADGKKVNGMVRKMLEG